MEAEIIAKAGAMRSKHFVLMVGLAIWVGAVAFRIEIKNIEAGSYLPRNGEVDGGKWRISRQGGPRDELRGIIRTFGLLQYPLGVALVVIAGSQISRGRNGKRLIVILCAATGAAAVALAVYRGYYSSLGW